METVRVKIADYGVLKRSGLLITIGLGSCVGIALYDAEARAAGLAHILLSESILFPNRENLAKFADTAVPLLLAEMRRIGADKNRIRAKIAGGSELFKYKAGYDTVGARNIVAVKTALSEARIPILAADVGGCVGRTMQLCAESGQVLIKKVGQLQQEL